MTRHAATAAEGAPTSTVVGRLLSVNVGLPRDVAWEGKTVRTAIWKEPVDGPRMARRINIDGDDQADRAGHGGEHRAVFVYQIDSYEYWKQQLQRDDFTYGQFGDDLIRLQTGPEQLSVADIDALLYLPNRSHRTLERALRIPALSEGWQESFRALLEQGEQDRQAPRPTAWEGFQPLTVVAVTRESSTIESFVLRPAERSVLDSALGGQYLTLRLRPGGTDQPAVIRTYSLSAITPESGFRISVKLEPGGAGSAFLHEHVRPGDIIDAAAPRGGFVLRDGDRPVALLSAGVGATPVLS